MEGLSKTQSHPLFFQATSAVQKYDQTHAAKLKSSLEKLCWASSSVWASSEPAKSRYGNIYSPLSWFHLEVFFFCHPFLSRFHRLTENICFSFPAAFPSRGSRPPRHGYHTGQEWRGQYPLCSHQCLCLTWQKRVRMPARSLIVPASTVTASYCGLNLKCLFRFILPVKAHIVSQLADFHLV